MLGTYFLLIFFYLFDMKKVHSPSITTNLFLFSLACIFDMHALYKAIKLQSVAATDVHSLQHSREE